MLGVLSVSVCTAAQLATLIASKLLALGSSLLIRGRPITAVTEGAADSPAPVATLVCDVLLGIVTPTDSPSVVSLDPGHLTQLSPAIRDPLTRTGTLFTQILNSRSRVPSKRLRLLLEIPHVIPRFLD